MKLLNRSWADGPINRKKKTSEFKKPLNKVEKKTNELPEPQSLEELYIKMQKIAHEFNDGVKNFVPGDISGDFLVIGEAPGADEDRLKIPFIGKSGKLLRTELEKNGLKPQDQSIINTVFFRPPNNKTPDNAAIRTYLPYLKQYIKLLRPKLILTAGSVPLRALMGFEKKITKIRGTLLCYNNGKDIPLIPTYHPSFVLRLGNRGTARESFVNDLKFAIKTYYESK
jgi:DNA polymerase